MKLTCELCGGMLERRTDGAVCQNCGLEHSEAWLQEKLAGVWQPAENPPVTPYHSRRHYAKQERNLGPMWVIMVLIGLYEFIGVLTASSSQQEAMAFLTSAAAMIVTLILFRPWKQ